MAGLKVNCDRVPLLAHPCRHYRAAYLGDEMRPHPLAADLSGFIPYHIRWCHGWVEGLHHGATVDAPLSPLQVSGDSSRQVPAMAGLKT